MTLKKVHVPFRNWWLPDLRHGSGGNWLRDFVPAKRCSILALPRMGPPFEVEVFETAANWAMIVAAGLLRLHWKPYPERVQHEKSNASLNPPRMTPPAPVDYRLSFELATCEFRVNGFYHLNHRGIHVAEICAPPITGAELIRELTDLTDDNKNIKYKAAFKAQPGLLKFIKCWGKYGYRRHGKKMKILPPILTQI